MPTLLEKIDASASQRLPLPAGRTPAQELARYKNFLKVESHRLRILHRAGGGGREICQARAAIMDALLRNLFDTVVKIGNFYLPQLPPLALLAIGGYGRGELNPHSDIDIMFLHDGRMMSGNKPHPLLEALTGAGGLLYTLYDIGLKVGPAVRSLDDCVKVANSDMQSKTSLIEARFIAGDAKLFDRFQKVVETKCVKGYEQEYIAARLADQSDRRAKYGNSACMQEPNIKNGCGGLRDYQNLMWMAYFKIRARTTEELRLRDLLSAAEAKQLEAAYDYLMRVRTDLHYHTGRPVDALPKSIQPAIAHNLGYTDRSPRKRLEGLMRDFYKHSRNIYLISQLVEQRLAMMPVASRFPTFREILRSRKSAKPAPVDGFIFLDGQIEAANARVFREQPRRLMRVFLYAQQRGLSLHPDLAQLIRQELSLVNRYFLEDIHVHETFLQIMDQRGDVARILRMMHNVDFLGKYIPEFGRLTCLVQHEFFHQYAADEHTLMCLQKLDDIWGAKTPPLNAYTEMFISLEHPHLLYLALLLHDAGKADDSGHHEKDSARLVNRMGKRLKLSAAAVDKLHLIVEQHLTMVQISQRRDLDDPAVIQSFAKLIETPENLVMLTLHTVADSLGTSDKIWNSFKDSLLWTLHRNTMNLIAGGPDFIRAEEKLRENLAKEVRKLAPSSFNEDELQAHFHSLPPRYFHTHTARDVMTDLALTHRFMHLQLTEENRALEPVTYWHNEPDRSHSVVKVCTWDRTGLFAKITGALTAAGLNILSAQIFSRGDGIIIDTLLVNEAVTGKPAERESKELFEKYLAQVLNDDTTNLNALIKKRKAVKPLYFPLEGEELPIIISFDNDSSAQCTVIDIETEDRVGLLYTIAQTLSDLKVDVILSKITTEKGAAIDSFYVTEIGGGKLLTQQRLNTLERKLRTAIAALE
ncbi:MAG TPA: [protein-PII] uridylyltransferase [Verrucomicrobiae bacterium]